MNYKAIIKNRDTRIKILQLLNFLPDRQMLQLQYRIKMGRKLNLKEPKRFTEKLQWYKLYYRDPLMAQCVDKFEVRNYIRDNGLSEILIPDYGVYDSAEDINWEGLPKSFVLKDTLGGGGNRVIICDDKKGRDEASIMNQLAIWTSGSPKAKSGGREWVYDGRKHRIYIESFLSSNKESGGLIEYKFFCFNGKARFLYVVADRRVNEIPEFGVFTADYQKLDAVLCDKRPLTKVIKKPENYSELVLTAEKLAKPFPQARIDLYDVEGHIYFGEITFFDGSGYTIYDPDSFDLELGEAFTLPEPL